MKSKDEIAYEKRVVDRVKILLDMLKTHAFHISSDQEYLFKESFEKIRLNDVGDPIIETIDGRIRSTALAVEIGDYRTKLKEMISLQDIQDEYFGYMHNYFSPLFEEMKKHAITPHDIARDIAYNSKSVDVYDKMIESFIESIKDFWEKVADSGYAHLEDNNSTVKAVFGGDLFPSHAENIASKCGIYIDTIVLPCPFMRSKRVFETSDKKQRVYFLIKHGLNILQYRELALARVDVPIVVVLPDK